MSCSKKILKDKNFMNLLTQRDRHLVERYNEISSQCSKSKCINILSTLYLLGAILFSITVPVMCVGCLIVFIAYFVSICGPTPWQECMGQCCNLVITDTWDWSDCDSNQTLQSFCEQDCSTYSNTRPNYFEENPVISWIFLICFQKKKLMKI